MIMIPFPDSFIEILNIQMPCLGRGMQEMGGKIVLNQGSL